ncbi:uncharacterized protein LOC144116184 [Amblyomma americanum]
MARRSTVQFSSIAEFQAWKENTERKEQAHFIAKRGVTRLSSRATKRYLECHRTGVAVQSRQGRTRPGVCSMVSFTVCTVRGCVTSIRLVIIRSTFCTSFATVATL